MDREPAEGGQNGRNVFMLALREKEEARDKGKGEVHITSIQLSVFSNTRLYACVN